MNVNVGGTKNWDRLSKTAQKNWAVLDVSGHPDFMHDLNSHAPFPFLDGEIDNYYTSETLEHVYPSEVHFVFGEMYRTLKPKGLIRVVVPNARLWFVHYVNGDGRWLKDNDTGSTHMPFLPPTNLGRLMTCFYSEVKNQSRTARTGHQTVFDDETLTYYLQHAGFKRLQQRKFGDCSQVFIGLDLRRYATTSLYMEATK